MTKTYKTRTSSAVITVSVNGRTRQVYLRNGFIGVGALTGGKFTTDDVELQRAIESHPRFNSGFNDQIWTDDKEVEAAPVEAQKAPAEKVEEKPAEQAEAHVPEDPTAPEAEEEKPAEQAETHASEDTTALEVEEEKPAEEAHEEAQTANGRVYPDVTKLAEVREILKNEYGKTHQEVKSNAQVLALINELGLVFPNLQN